MVDTEKLLHLGREILHRMVAVGKNVTIYPLDHPSVMDHASEMCELLKPLFAESQNVKFNIVANSEIYIEKKLLHEESIKYSDFIQLLAEREVNNLYFNPSVTPESIAAFFSLICRKEQSGEGEESLEARVQEQGIVGIDFGKLVALDLGSDIYQLADGEEEALHPARSAFNHALEYMESVERDVLSNRAINANTLRAVVTSLMEDFLNDRDAVVGIMSIKNYDEYLFHHSVNVAVTCLLIANKLCLSDSLMKTVGICGLLHDIGKLKVPREIMAKPERLTETEWTLMRRHPIEGAQILMRYENLGELPVLAALEHHMGYDMSGYPGLKRTGRQHSISRIVGIADAYEAITANRSFRPARTLQEAVQALVNGAGKQFDPLLVKLLLNTTGVFPPGSFVRLKSGETAVVIEPNEDEPFYPKVRTVSDETGASASGDLINTAEEPARYAVTGIADSAKV